MANTNTQVTIDLSNYKEKVGARVPEGRYRVIVEDIQKDESKQGNDMVNLWLEIVSGEHAGAVLVDRLVLTERSLFRVVAFMQAIGLATPKKRLAVNIAAWKGKALFVDVADGEPYNGKVKSEVKGYEKIRGVAAPAAADPWASEEPRTAPSDGLDEFAATERPSDPWDGVEAASGAPAAAHTPLEADAELEMVGLEDVDLDKLQL